jgi:transcriptional antiterminator RfaH
MAFWACAQLLPQRERFALQMLAQARYETYAPRLREWRTMRNGQRQREVALFPGYVFLVVTNGWYAARWCPGVGRLVMDGLQPAKVPDAVIEEIRGRERNGAVELPKRRLQYGDRVKILAGPFRGHLAMYAGMSGSERVAVLLQILGSQQRATLAQRDVEAIIF